MKEPTKEELDAKLIENEACASLCESLEQRVQGECHENGNWLNDDGFARLYGRRLAKEIRDRR